MKKRIVKTVALMMTLCFFAGITANAASYEYFPKMFNWAPGAPSDVNRTSQTVEVQGNANANAYAKCTYYAYTGDQPVLTVYSVSTQFPTNSVSFTGTTSSGRAMKYTEAIPPTNKTVKFRGYVANYTAFSISAQVKG